MEDNKQSGVYIKNLLQKNVNLHINESGKQVKQNLENKLHNMTIGKCISEGFIKPNSINIISYTSGIINGEWITYKVIFECFICNPVEGMIIECITRNITKAGISAESLQNDDGYNPLNIFIARDHHYSDNYFNNINENQKINIVVIGSRFELNDPNIVVIGKLKNDKNDKDEKHGGTTNSKLKPTINIL